MGLVSRRAREGLHLFLVGLLAAAFALQLIKDVPVPAGLLRGLGGRGRGARRAGLRPHPGGEVRAHRPESGAPDLPVRLPGGLAGLGAGARGRRRRDRGRRGTWTAAGRGHPVRRARRLGPGRHGRSHRREALSELRPLRPRRHLVPQREHGRGLHRPGRAVTAHRGATGQGSAADRRRPPGEPVHPVRRELLARRDGARHRRVPRAAVSRRGGRARARRRPPARSRQGPQPGLPPPAAPRVAHDGPGAGRSQLRRLPRDRARGAGAGAGLGGARLRGARRDREPREHLQLAGAATPTRAAKRSSRVLPHPDAAQPVPVPAQRPALSRDGAAAPGPRRGERAGGRGVDRRPRALAPGARALPAADRVRGPDARQGDRRSARERHLRPLARGRAGRPRRQLQGRHAAPGGRAGQPPGDREHPAADQVAAAGQRRGRRRERARSPTSCPPSPTGCASSCRGRPPAARLGRPPAAGRSGCSPRSGRTT